MVWGSLTNPNFQAKVVKIKYPMHDTQKRALNEGKKNPKPTQTPIFNEVLVVHSVVHMVL